MSFTDDLLLFVKGDVESIELLMIVFVELSSCTDLFVNPAKCHIYFGNIEDNIKMKIMAFTNYHEGKLPFRYFGIPPTNNKNSIFHDIIQVDKIVSRVKHWSSILLSLAGRF